MSDARRAFYAAKNALGTEERALIKTYETYWMFSRTVPTVDQVTEDLKKKFPKIAKTAVNYYLTRPPVIKALEKRGITFRQHTQEELTDQQLAAALTVSNFADERSNAEKLDELGISSATYFAWLQDPVFQNHVQMLADRSLKHIDPVAKTEFAKKVQSGEWTAVKYYMETTGALVQPQGADTESLIRAIIEIIQTRVKDPETILAIANDIKLAAANRTLAFAIEGEAVQISDRVPSLEDKMELERAQKMVGF
jgi:hypothetical protein